MKHEARRRLIYAGGLLAFVVVGGGLGIGAVSIFGTKSERCVQQCRSQGKAGVLRPTLPQSSQGKNLLTECRCE